MPMVLAPNDLRTRSGDSRIVAGVGSLDLTSVIPVMKLRDLGIIRFDRMLPLHMEAYENRIFVGRL